MSLAPITCGTKTLFTVEEQACNHCGKGKLPYAMIDETVRLRMAFGLPMHPSSFCRCHYHNTQINNGKGGHPRSLHVFDKPYHPTGGCIALDAITSHEGLQYRHKLIDTARKLEWSIGFHSDFLHLDARTKILGMPRAEFNY